MNHLVRSIARTQLRARNAHHYSASTGVPGATGKGYSNTMPMAAEAYPLVVIISAALVGGSLFAGNKLKEVLAVRNVDPTHNPTMKDRFPMFAQMKQDHEIISDN